MASSIAMTAGCSDPTAPPGDDASSIDGSANPDGSAGLDAARDATSGPCTAAADCDDGQFCNGHEACDPSSSSADVRGCVAGSAPCTATCDEAADRCAGCPTPDADHDGFDSVACGGTDCDDANSNRSPSRPEVCDPAGIDEDCNPTTFGFRDSDADGHIDAACCNTADTGAMACGDDCNDLSPTSHPTATEACDGFDNDCDTSIDEGVRQTYYVDADGDGFGVDATATNVAACTQPSGHTLLSGDCNDDPAANGSDVHPGAYDVCDGTIDHDCDGTVDNPPDGCTCTPTQTRPCMLPGVCASGTETCDLGRWGTCSVPRGTETCNGLDDDCDGTVDDGVTVTCYADPDSDLYAGVSALATAVCPDAARAFVGGCPTGYTNRVPVGATLDCNPSDGNVSPSATEVCNGLDDNCNGTVDDGLRIVCYDDHDLDRFPAGGAPATMVCPDSTRPSFGTCPINYTNVAPVPGMIDCVDNDASISPAALEICDAIMRDENCNGMTNEAVTIACYVDVDLDGYAATSAATIPLCPDGAGNCPTGFTRRMPVPGATDCNDASALVSPLGAETCNTADDDCDGRVDEFVTTRFYRDADNDLFGVGSLTMDACAAPSGFVDNANDCNDMVSSIYPGASEVCNALDDDCDAVADDGLATVNTYLDADGDGHGSTTLRTPARCGPFGMYVLNSDDCNDANAGVHPGAYDICGNGLDDDCAGGDGLPLPIWYPDVDGDGFGVMAGSVTQCNAPPTGQWASRGGDCLDTYGYNFVYPGAPELCDGLDDDCSSAIDGTEIPNAFGLNHPLEDNDGDGHGDASCPAIPGVDHSLVAATLDDCNDTASDVYGGATEIVGNAIDNDCNGGEVCFQDGDNDGYRTSLTVVSTDADCSDAGEAALALPPTDCADANAAVHPGGALVADNGLDDNCNGRWECYFDADNDGYSRADAALRDDSLDNDCLDAGEGATSEPRTDCNDGDANISPGDPETPDNAVDENCNGLWGCYTDADDDGYRPNATAFTDVSTNAVCTDAYEAVGTDPTGDCGDSSPAVRPGAFLVADNGLDDNCNGLYECYYDADNDGYSRVAGVQDTSADNDCLDLGEGSASEPRTDCNDNVASIHPGATLVPDDAVDQNCNGFYECYYDADNDGYSRSDAAIRDDSADTDCADTGEGASAEARTDCCDTASNTHPGVTAWFTSANACGSFDYDCVGGATRQWTDGETCADGAGGASCSAFSGWGAAVPACGVSATYVSCTSATPCGRSSAARVQACH